MPQPIVSNNRLLLVKTESAKGVDSVPTESVNAVLCDTLEVTKMNTKTVDRKPVQPFLGAGSKIVASFDSMVKVKLALAIGANDEGVPTPTATPHYDAFLACCGFQRTTTATAVNGTAQGGTLNSIQLASGASATHDFYSGQMLAATVASGTAQAPGSSAKNIIKIKATDKEHGDTLQSGSTTTVLNFATTASAEDGYYVGMSVKIDSDIKTISDYNGTTKQATVSSAFGSAPGTVTYNVLRVDDYYQNYLILVKHFAGTVVDAGQSLSDTRYIYLPSSVVGSNNVKGLDIKVTTGSNAPETRRVVNYDVASRRCVLDRKLTVEPTSASTFVLSETVKVTTSNGDTRVLTLQRNLKFVTSATTDYEILAYHMALNYNGTTKVASVTPPFKRRPNEETTYQFGPNIEYSLLSANIPTVTLYYYEDTTLYAFTGSLGDLTLSGDAQNLGFLEVSLTGILDRYESATLPTPTTLNFAEPLPINAANTLALSLHSFADIVMKKFSLSLGNKITHVDAPGANEIRLTDREVKGSVTIEAVQPEDFDFLDAIKQGDMKEFLFSHGPLGNNFTVFCGDTQLSNPKDSISDNIIEVAMDLNMPAKVPGNNEVKFILQ